MKSVTAIKTRLAQVKDAERATHKYYHSLGRLLLQEEMREWGQEAGSLRLESIVLEWVLSGKAPEANKISSLRTKI